MIGLADEPLQIDWTPEFMRSFGGAMLDSPGPLDAGQQTFFSITPVRDEWSADEVESYLREMNTRQLRLLTIHEAVPGHYLQGAYCNRGASLARRVFRSGMFAEGWAVYVTQVMLDLGYGDGDPALWLVHWKFYLRAVVNAILDVRIHTMGMTSEEAIDAHGRGRVPGARRGARQGRAGAAVVDPAGDLLPRLHRDVGDRGRRCAGGRPRRRARARTPSRRPGSSAATARRRASTSGPTSRTRSRTARRRSRSSAGSCSTERRERRASELARLHHPLQVREAPLPLARVPGREQGHDEAHRAAGGQVHRDVDPRPGAASVKVSSASNAALGEVPRMPARWGGS